MTRRYSNDFTLMRKSPAQIGSLRSTSGWAICDGVLKEFAPGLPRLVPGVGILIEPEVVNLLPYSRQIESGNGWTLNNCIPSGTMGVDGAAVSGTEMDPTSAADFSRTVSAPYGKFVFSLFIKIAADNEDPVYISINSQRIECVGISTEYQRFSITHSTGNPTVKVEFTEPITVDCLQLETGLVPTSPIPNTTSGTALRESDQLYMAWMASGVTPFNPATGTFVINVAMTKLTSSDQVLMKMYDHLGSTPEYLRIAVKRTDITRFNIGYDTPKEYTFIDPEDEAQEYDLNLRIATSFINNIQSVSVNGQMPIGSTQTEAIDFDGIQLITLGSDEYADHMCGYLTEFTYFDEYMEPAKLAQLSNDLVGDIDSVDVSNNDESEFDEVIAALYRNRNKLSMYNFMQSLENTTDQDVDTAEEIQVLNNSNMINNLN